MNPKPVISVIVAVYNGAKTLQRCIDSVSNQTYPHKELIIIDGGSTDSTVEILRANNDKIAYWKSEPDRGIYHAWNKALDHAHGDWICFLGSDDYFWKPDVLERAREHLVKAASTGIRVVYGQVARVSKDGVVLQIDGESWEKARRKFMEQMAIPHPGLMHHRSLFELRGKFDESFRIAGDYEMLLRELKTAEALFICKLTIVGMQCGGMSEAMGNSLKSFREVTYARRKNGMARISLQWVRNYVWAIVITFLLQMIGEKGVWHVIDFYRRLTGRASYWTKQE